MQDDEDRPFEPDWVSPPYESVQDCLDEKQIPLDHFCMHMGWDAVQCQNFFSDIVVIDQSIADRLASIVGGTSAFWQERQRQYTESFIKLKAAGAAEGLEILGEEELKNPQMLEIFMYEDRKGHHCIVTKMQGREMRSKIQYRFRHPLHSKPTMDVLYKTLDLLTGFLEIEKEDATK